MRCGEWLHCYASAHSVETYHAPPVGSRFRSPFDWAELKHNADPPLNLNLRFGPTDSVLPCFQWRFEAVRGERYAYTHTA